MKKLRQKWIDGLPNDEYHWGKPYVDCLNTSKLKKLAISPAHCKSMEKTTPTKALRIGTLFHALSLNEPFEEKDFKEDEIETAKKMVASLLK